MSRETPDQRACRVSDWLCPCHLSPLCYVHTSPWRPAWRCLVCDHPNLAHTAMPAWWVAWQAHHGEAVP